MIAAMPRRILTLLLLAPLLPAQTPPPARGLEVDARELPRTPPRTPAEERATFQLAGGLRVELVAAEPQVVDPVAMAFDEHGRLWVCEMIDYPYDERDGQPPRGRVRLLRDEDGDGRYERATVFRDGLSWPTAVAPARGGVLVVAAPRVLWLADRDGDDRAEVEKVIVEGLGRRNVQALANGLVRSPDGWWIVANGGNGGNLRSPLRPQAPPLRLGGRDFRFRLEDGRIEPLAGGGQFGVTLDDFGERFVCNNSDHARHVVLEPYDLAPHPGLRTPAWLASIAVEGPSAPVFRVSPPEPWRVVRTRLRVQGLVPGPVEHGGRASGYFTSATGITVYRGTSIPGWYGDLVVGDVASNLVHHKVLRRKGATFEAARAESGREAWASTDLWFRPVNFANGPDGALYVCDMYREVVEHPWSLPAVIRRHLDLGAGSDRGRIWRLTSGPGRRPVLLAGASTAELVAALGHPDGWVRDTAARLLFERGPDAACATLRAHYDRLPPAGKLPALWLLETAGALEPERLAAALGDPNPGLRREALRLAERHLDREPVRRAVLARLGDPDARVRLRLPRLLARFPQAEARATLVTLARADGGDRWLRVALLAACGGERGRTILEHLLEGGGSRVPLAFAVELARMVGARPGAGAALPAILARGDARLAERLAAALAEGGAPTRGEAWRAIFTRAARRALEAGLTPTERVHAVRLLGYAPADLAQRSLLALLRPSAPPAVQAAAVRALDRALAERAVPRLLQAFEGAGPRLRDAILDVLLQRPAGALALLDAVDEARVPRAALDARRRQGLLRHPSPEVAARAERVLGDAGADRRAVIRRYAPAVRAGGDPARGKAVFSAHCAACHRRDGEGGVVGPPLDDARGRDPETLLQQILDPNAEVAPRYTLYGVTTTDGRTLAGIVTAESDASITLRDTAGGSATLLRSRIATLRALGTSPMPEGLEAAIPPARMADLIAWLREGD